MIQIGVSISDSKQNLYIMRYAVSRKVIERMGEMADVGLIQDSNAIEPDDEKEWKCPICKEKIYWWSEDCDSGHDIRDIADHGNALQSAHDNLAAQLSVANNNLQVAVEALNKYRNPPVAINESEMQVLQWAYQIADEALRKLKVINE